MHNRIFFSYTLRDNEVTAEILLKLKNKFKDFTTLDTYFDILDNHAPNHQEYVYQALSESYVLCLIKTSGINESAWVSKELLIAKMRNMPIIEICKKELSEILNSASKNDFEGCLKIKQIIHVAQKIVDPRITSSNIVPKRLKYNSV